MPNTINGVSRKGVPSPSGGNGRPGQVAGGATVLVSSAAGTEVSVSAAASQLASLGEELSALPALDAARVERVSHALAAGTYSISADKIASGLLQSENALAQIGM